MDKSSALSGLSALSQETRLDIFRLLVQAGGEGVPAGRIGEALDLPWPTLSFHLAQLRHGGLITARREGRSIIYAADYTAMDDLIGYLTENCCAGGKACAPAPIPNPKGASRHEAPTSAHRR